MRRRKNKPSLTQPPIGEYVFSSIIGRTSSKKKGIRERERIYLSHNIVACLFAYWHMSEIE